MMKIENTDEGQKLIWKDERKIPSRLFVSFYVMIWLLNWLIICEDFNSRGFSYEQEMVRNFIFFCQTGPVIIFLLFLAALIRGPRQGILSLNREFLIYKPGSPKPAAWFPLSLFYPAWSFSAFLTGGKQLVFQRQNIKEIYCVCNTNGYQVTLRTEKTSYPIGLYLSDIEKKGYIII